MCLNFYFKFERTTIETFEILKPAFIEITMSKTEALDWFSKSERIMFQSRMLITYDIKLPSKCTEMWHKLKKLPIKTDVSQSVSWLIAGSLMWNMRKHFKKDPEHGTDCLKMCLTC